MTSNSSLSSMVTEAFTKPINEEPLLIRDNEEPLLTRDKEDQSIMGISITRPFYNEESIENGKKRMEDKEVEEKDALSIAQITGAEEHVDGMYYTFDKNRSRTNSVEEKVALVEVDQSIPRSNALPNKLIIFNISVVAIVVVSYICFSVYDGSNSGALSSTPRLILGVLNALVGSLLTASAYCCQKWAHNQALIHVDLQPATKQPIFIWGLTLLVLGTVSALMNLGLLGQAIQAPLTGLTLIYNAVLAKTILKEEYSRRDFYCNVLIIGGVAVSVSGAGLSEVVSSTYDLDRLLQLFLHESAMPLLYTILMTLAIIFISVIVKEKKLQLTGFGLFGYSFSAGAMAGFTSLTVKSVLEIFKSVVERDSRDEFRPMTYVFVLLIPISLFLQLMYMNEGLKYFGTLKFVPLYQSFIILSNMTCGAVYFEEMARYTILSKILFFTGCCITISGMFISLPQ